MPHDGETCKQYQSSMRGMCLPCNICCNDVMEEHLWRNISPVVSQHGNNNNERNPGNVCCFTHVNNTRVEGTVLSSRMNVLVVKSESCLRDQKLRRSSRIIIIIIIIIIIKILNLFSMTVVYSSYG